MISIKCKLKNPIEIDDYLRQFNNVVRFAYNRFSEGMSLSEVYHKCKIMNNVTLLDASFVESAVLRAKTISETSGKGVIFGGKKEFEKLVEHKESEFRTKRNKWLYSQGRATHKGNRKFNFDLNNNKVVFKPKKGIKIECEFEDVSKKSKRDSE